jgi:plastocyanin
MMGGATNVFDPAKLEIKPGDSVRWKNVGGTHTATSDDIKTGNPKKTFNTGSMNKGDEAVIVFNNEGTFDYHCEYHGPMKGMITVQK